MPQTRIPEAPGALPRTPDGLALDALAEIAAGLAQIDRRVPLAEGDDPSLPRSIRLIATESYDVWLITWPPGSELRGHDHCGATSVMRVVGGSLVESTGAAHWLRRPGTSAVTPPHTSHALRNASGAESTSLHVYSPPLEAINYPVNPAASAEWGVAAGAGRLAPVRPRQAEATSKSGRA